MFYSNYIIIAYIIIANWTWILLRDCLSFQFILFKWSFINEPVHDKTYKPTKWPMRPANTQISLGICCLHCPHEETRVLSFPLSALRRLIRLGGCPGWSEPSLGSQVILLVLSCGGSISDKIILFRKSTGHAGNQSRTCDKFLYWKRKSVSWKPAIWISWLPSWNKVFIITSVIQ